MSSITFGIIKTHNPNREILKDDSGYYKVTLGAINCYNSTGAFYLQDGVKELIEDKSSLFARRLASGYLHGEMDHPELTPGMSQHDFILRNLKIDHANISHHIKSVELKQTDDDSKMPGKGKVVKIMGLVKPAGPKGDLLKQSLENGDINTSFSIRSLTTDANVGGTIIKKIVQIVTWDWVIEPGIAYANKWHTASMETFDIAKFNVEELEKYIDMLSKNNLSREDNNVRTLIKELKNVKPMFKSTNKFLYGW